MPTFACETTTKSARNKTKFNQNKLLMDETNIKNLCVELTNLLKQLPIEERAKWVAALVRRVFGDGMVQQEKPVVTENDFNGVCEKVLDAMRKRSKEHKVVVYTYKDAQNELNLGKDLFYGVIKQLEKDGKLYVMKGETKDGKPINKYVLSAETSGPKLKVVSEKFISDPFKPGQYSFGAYFKKNPIIFEPTWSKETFLAENDALIDEAFHSYDLRGITLQRERFNVLLWEFIQLVNSQNKLINAK